MQIKNLPFKVVILEADSHLCALCIFKSKYTEEKTNVPVDCPGCEIYQSNDQIKWILGCFKRLEVCIDWSDPLCYKNPTINSDITCLRLMQQEKELMSGFPLSQCLDLYTKKQKIEDYNCENCKQKTVALIDTRLSKLPDIMIIHLKRFSYHSGYLEKIEDLVTFPLSNLELTKYISRF